MLVYIVIETASGYDNSTYDPITDVVGVYDSLDKAEKVFKESIEKYKLEDKDDGEEFLGALYYSCVNYEEDYSAKVSIILQEVE